MCSHKKEKKVVLCPILKASNSGWFPEGALAFFAFSVEEAASLWFFPLCGLGTMVWLESKEVRQVGVLKNTNTGINSHNTSQRI